MIKIKRIYQAADPGDGTRVLVDRVWPRGMARDRAGIDAWLPDAGPSSELRKWFGHDPERWAEFRERYRAELADNAHVADLLALAAVEPLTLLYSARDTEHNQAVVLAEYVSEHLGD